MKHLGLLLLFPMAVHAVDADLLNCSRLTDATARLACYDQLAARVGRAAAAPVQASVQTPVQVPAVAPAVKAEAAFGAVPKPQEELAAIHSHIVGDFEGWGPRTLFTLANGQRWMVSDGSSAVVYRKDPKVTISRGAMGSFWFEVQGSKSAAKVKRID